MERVVTAFALAVRNCSVYPADHPRLRAGVEDFLGLLGELEELLILALDEGVVCNGVPVSPGPQSTWIYERFKKASMRGIRVTRQCTTDDLLEFATALISRDAQITFPDAGEDRTWLTLEPIPLVFRGTFEAQDGQSLPRGLEGMLGGPSPDDPVEGSAGRVARRYFGLPTSDADSLPEGKPTGRPEDAGIEADLDALLAEIEDLPPAARPEVDRAALESCVAKPMAEQLLGVYLYLFQSDDDPTARRNLARPLRRTLLSLGPASAPLLDNYLLPDTGAVSSIADRQELLQLLEKADQVTLAAERGYVDLSFVVSGFPDTLPIAAQVLGYTESGLELLRRALLIIEKRAGEKNLEQTVNSEAILRPKIVRSLLRVGGHVARLLVDTITKNQRHDLFAELLECAVALQIQPPERAALATIQLEENGTAAYLRMVFAEAGYPHASKQLRGTSGKLLRRRVQDADAIGDEERLIERILVLALVPGPETTALLADLAGTKGLFAWFRRSRRVRNTAREVLASVGRTRK